MKCKVDVGGMCPVKGKRLSGCGKSELYLGAGVSYVGRGQKWHRAVDLYGEGQGSQGGEIAREGSVWCREPE